MISNLIFDFDGIIIDTETSEFISWQEIYQEYGCKLEKEIWADCIGRPHGYFDPYAYLEELSGRKVNRDRLSAKRQERARALNNSLPILPGIDSLIAEAKARAFGLAVVSSSDRSWVFGHLKRIGLYSAFNVLICAEDTKKHKPDPEPYLAALKRLQCRAEDAVVFEDAPPGIRSAKAAGIPCVAIPSPMTRHMSFDDADLLLNSAADLSLESLLKRISQ